MSSLILLKILAFLCYCGAFFVLYRRVKQSTSVAKTGLERFTWWALAALGLQAFTLYGDLFSPQGFDLSIYHALSLWVWFMGLLLLLMLRFGQLENLGLVLFPILALGVLVDTVFSSQHITSIAGDNIAIHIVISILAYSCLAVAAVQGAILGVQDRFLHKKEINAFTRAFPPLQVMEQGLFQLIAIGFILQSFSLLSGFLFVENLFSQHLVHKTVFSLASWGVFGGLLWGRWRHGLRGKLVVRWLMVGFVILLLGYFGSKLVLEIILKLP